MKVSNKVSIKHVPIDDLRPDPANPRHIREDELEALSRSIQEFGMVDPIIARREDHTVIGGHQRLLAARRLGMKTVPVVLLDISVEQARLLNLALNKISGSWDEELLARLVADLNEQPEIDITLAGFSNDELARLLKSVDAREKRERVETFDVEAAVAEARQASSRSQLGDIWELGDHRLLHGDAMDHGMIERMLEGERAQMAFVDPPYNVDYGSHGGQQPGARRRSIANDALAPEEWEWFVGQWVKNLLRYTDGAVYCCMSSKELPLVSGLFALHGGHWSDTIIWAKDHFTLGRADYQRQYESIWYGWREGVSHHWCGDRDQGDVWQIPRPVVSPLHPTMKPLELVERAIENSSQRGDVVLDLFLGSGTTLIAAERTERVCYAVELDGHYVDVAIARWEAFTGQQAARKTLA